MRVPDAITSKIESEVRPVVEKFSKLKSALETYEAEFRQAAEQNVNNAILVALGQVPAPNGIDRLADVRKNLCEVLREVATIVDPLPITTSTPEPKRVPPPKVVRKAQPEDIESAKRLLVEIEELRTGVKDQHHARLSPLLQAVVAEVRGLLDRLPEDHFYSDRLSKSIPVLGSLKNEGGVKEFIKGLAFHSEGDWSRIAHTNRRKVAAFDKDTEKNVVDVRQIQKAKAAEPKKPKEEVAASNYDWPEFPNLRELTKPVLLAGGMVIPEKFDSIYERTGINVEWHEIDHNNPRAVDTLLTRIKGGKVGAIICIEGFMKHGTFKPLVNTCVLASVPMAMGGKGGIAAITTALEELEKKLGKT